MVGMFSKLFVGKNAHRRTQSAVDGREVLNPNTEVEGSASSVRGVANTHGIEIAVEFKPVEHPTEPLDNDRPLQCPVPEPSILNDGRIWKERVSGGLGNREDLAFIQELAPALPAVPEAPTTRPHVILPSVSAPEHDILKLLDESGIYNQYPK